MSNKVIILGVLFLACFLPYYSLLRGVCLIYLPVSISGLISVIRDLVIIFIFVVGFMSLKMVKIKLNNITLAINVLLISLMFNFFMTCIRGYPEIAVQAAHLSIIPILIFYSAKRAQKSNPLFLLRFLNLFLIIGLSVGVFSLYFYFIRPQLFIDLFNVLYSVDGETSEELAASYSRMMGPFFSPNVFGNYMATIGVISFVNIVKNEHVQLNWIIFFISTSNVILSFSRGSWLFELVGLLIVIYFLKRSVKPFLKFIVISTIAVLVGISSLSYSSSIDLKDVLSMRLSTVSSGQSDVYERFGKLDEVISIIEKNPFGAGLGAGSQASAGQIEYVSEVGVNVIDGYYLKLLAEGGIFGLTVFLLVMSYVILVLIKKINKHKVNLFNLRKEFIVIGLAITVGTMFQSIGSNPLDYIATAPFIWVFLGVSSELY